MVAAAAITTAAVTTEARTKVIAAMVLVVIDLVALVIAHFVTRHIVATAIACVVANAIAFVRVCVFLASSYGWVTVMHEILISSAQPVDIPSIP